jgi:hypothetical protein
VIRGCGVVWHRGKLGKLTETIHENEKNYDGEAYFEVEVVVRRRRGD